MWDKWVPPACHMTAPNADPLSPYLSICVTTPCIIAPITSRAELWSLCPAGSLFHMLQAVCSSPFLPSREGPLSLSRLWRNGFVCLFEVSCCRDGPMPSVPTAGSLQRASGLPWQQTFKTSSRLGSGSQLNRVCEPPAAAAAPPTALDASTDRIPLGAIYPALS